MIEIEQIEEESQLQSAIAEANDLTFMLTARLDETKNMRENMEIKLGYMSLKPQRDNNVNNEENEEGDGEIDNTNENCVRDTTMPSCSQDTSNSASTCNSGTAKRTLRSIKPPQATLPKFYGNSDDFPEYWAVFEALVHNSEELDIMEKILLLKESLKGRAQTAIKGIKLIPENYNWLIKTLQENYSNHQSNRSQIVKKLVSMSVANNSADICSATFDQIRMLTYQMISAGYHVGKTCDPMWCETILSKFPEDIIKSVLVASQSQDRQTVDDLMNLLKIEITAKVYVESRLGHKHINKAIPSKTNHDNLRTNRNCLFCHKDNHVSMQCRTVTDQSIRRKMLKEQNRCWKCCSPNHSSFDCQRSDCLKCGQKHHMSLCFKTEQLSQNNSSKPKFVRVGQNQQRQHSWQNREENNRNIPQRLKPINTQVSVEPPQIKENSIQHSQTSKQLILMTAEGNIWDARKQTYEKVLFFFDSGAQKTVIEENLAQQLGLPKNTTEICTMSGIGGHIECFESHKVPVKLGTAFGGEICMTIQTKPVITNGFPSVKLNTEDIEFLKTNTICLANSKLRGEHQNPHILVGLDYYHDLVTDPANGIRTPSGFHIAKTVFGPTIYGRGISKVSETANTVCHSLTISENTEQELLQKMFELDGLGIMPEETQGDEKVQRCFEEYSKLISFENNIITAPFPLKENVIQLENNYSVAIRRLESLQNILLCNPEQKQWYCDLVNKYVSEGIVENFDTADRYAAGIYYMPHRGVWKPQKMVPLGIVFDASSKRRGHLSLNDVIRKGESFVNRIHDILTSSRFTKIVLMCDIESAFTQIRLVDAHKDLCRFLWLRNVNHPPTKDNVKYRFRRLPFGVTACPSILNMAILSYLESQNSGLSTEIAKNLYVDNILLQAKSVPEAVRKYKESKYLFSKIGMNLREYISNSEEVNSRIPYSDKLQSGSMKILGVDYNTITDNFTVRTKFVHNKKLTKGDVVSQTNSIYDPIGLTGPLMVKLKSMMREIFDSKVDWKTPLDQKICDEWYKLCKEVDLATLSIPRYVLSPRVGDGLPASAVPGLTHKIIVSRTSVRPKACNQLTGRCKGGGLESPPTNKLHMSTLGERKFSQKPMGLEACNLPVGFKFHAKNSNRKESPDSGRKPGTVAPGRTGLQESCRLPKRKRTRMTICTYNARTLASEATIEDLMVQAKKIKYDVIGLTETRRRHSLNAVFETGEELFLGTCDNRGVGGVGVLVNTSMAQNIDSFEQLTTRIGRLRMRRCGPTPALTIFVAYAPTSSYEEEEVEAFYMDLEKFYREDHAFYKVIIGDFNAKVGPRRTPEELHIGTHGLQWNDQGERLSEFIMTTKTIHGNSQFQKPSSLRWTWESPGGGYRNEIDHIIVNKRFCLTDVAVVPKFYTGSDHRLLRGRFSFTRRAEKAAKFSKRNPRTTINWDLFATLAGFWEDSAMDNIDEEYDRLVKHLHDCAKKAESIKTTKRRLSLETLELIRQRGAARAAGNQELTSELARLCREAIKKDLKERRAEVLAEAAEAGKSIRYARRDFASRKTKMTALRNPKGTTIASRRGMEKIIYDFYSDLFDSRAHLPPHHLREDGHVIPAVLPSEIRHAIMSVRNRTAAGPDRIKPEHLKNLPPVLINTLARIFTRYLSECKVPKQWKTSKTVLLYKKGDPHDIGNYRPICLLSVIYKLFTRVILNRIEKVLDEGQPCEQAGFRKGFSTIDHIHTVSRLIEVSREYKMPLCLTFIDLKKAFDSVETEAVVEALDNQGVPTQYIKVLRELYSNFTTGISPFYKNIIIDVKRGVRQGDTISPKIFTATLENAMRKLEWDDMGVKIDGRQLHHLRFADDIVLITPSISQAERMLTEFAETCGCIGLELNLQKTMFMRNGWISDAPFTLNGTNISECTSYVYLGRELNMMNDLAPELGRRRRAAWGAYKSIEDVVKKTKNTRLRAHLFNTTVLPALTYASETWALRKQEENAVSVIERAIERVMLGVSRFKQVRDGIRSSLLRQRSKIRDAAAFAKESKIRWAGHVMRFNDNRWTRAVSDWIPRDIKRNTGRPPTRWSDFFTKSFKENYDALRVPRERRNHWATLARDRDKWKNYWRPLDRFEDQRESSIKQQLDNRGATVKFFHVSTENNLADAGTRGLTAQEIIENDWIKGPRWLENHCSGWPIKSINTLSDVHENDEIETMVTTTLKVTTSENKQQEQLIDLKRFSKIDNVLRVLAKTAKTMKNWVAKTNQNRSSPIKVSEVDKFDNVFEITASDMVNAERLLISHEHRSINLDALKKAIS
ncbi:hypothetical protein RB195_023326 [Necator americanus]|uniref:Reverse transcriptase domain-containing protein n=1 Tax=Necator americanus TaxID=51031 RepID=A0ABR1EIP9_NECAM